MIGRVRGTESPDAVNALCFACPFPERGTNWRGSPRSEPDALNAPERACNRFPGVAVNNRDDAGGNPRRRLTHDRCLDQALPEKPAT